MAESHRFGRHHCRPRDEAMARRIAESLKVPFEDLLVLWSLRYDDEDTFPEECAASRIYQEARGTLGYTPTLWKRHYPFDDFDLKLWILVRASAAMGARWEPEGGFVGGIPEDPAEREMLLRIEREMSDEYRREYAVLNRMIPARMPEGWEGAVRCHEFKSLTDLEGYLREELMILRSSMNDGVPVGDAIVEAHQAWRNAWRIFDVLDVVDRPDRGEDPGPPFETERRLSELLLWLRRRAVDHADDVEWIGPNPIKEWSKRLHVSTKTIDRWRKNGDIRTKAGPGKLFFIDAGSVSARETNRDILSHSETNGDTVKQ